MNGIRRSLVGKVKGGYRLAGGADLVRLAMGLRHVAILCYHDPAPRLFENHLIWLKRKYNPISMDLLAEAVMRKDPGILPDRPLVLTLDDGWRGNYNLLPAIEKYEFPVLIYAVAEVAGTRRKFWYKAVEDAGEDAEFFKVLSDEKRLLLLKRRFGWEPEREYDEACALSREQMLEMKDSGLVSFGSHSSSHPILTRCSDEKSRREIENSKKLLERMLDTRIDHFCYPNGDAAEREQKYCRDAGYLTARSVLFGWNEPRSLNRFDLKIIGQPETSSIEDMTLMGGGWTVLRRRLGME